MSIRLSPRGAVALERTGPSVTLGRVIMASCLFTSDEAERVLSGLTEALSEVNWLAQEVGSWGCELIDVDEGLIDFQTMVDGDEVCLCRKLGGPKINWWHSLQTGFVGRQALLEQR